MNALADHCLRTSRIRFCTGCVSGAVDHLLTVSSGSPSDSHNPFASSVVKSIVARLGPFSLSSLNDRILWFPVPVRVLFLGVLHS